MGTPTALLPYSIRITTPLGLDLVVTSDNDDIVASTFAKPNPTRRAVPHPLLAEARRQVKAYFARRLLSFDLPLRFEGTPLQVEIWRFVSRLSFAEVISYGDVGHALGHPNIHRAVAAAMGCAPFDLFVPAHRVIGADGRIKGAGAGSLRRRLLIYEGRLTTSGGDAIRALGQSRHCDPPPLSSR